MPPATEDSKVSATCFSSAKAGKRDAVRREQGLVRGDDGLAVRQSGLDAEPRRAFGAADQLDEQIDASRRRERRGIGEEFKSREIGVAFFRGITRRKTSQLDFPACALPQRLGLTL